jgi:hypothetical protein
MNHHRALGYRFKRMIFSGPLHTFPDHALDIFIEGRFANAWRDELGLKPIQKHKRPGWTGAPGSRNNEGGAQEPFALSSV